MKTPKHLLANQVFAIPVGDYFGKAIDACYLIYSPLANAFFLSLPQEVEAMDKLLAKGERNNALDRVLNQNPLPHNPVTLDTFCTLHLLLNERCNFKCQYCYSASGRSSAELSMEQIETTLNYFLSSQRKAVKERTVMFMGGGEPVLSWNKLEEATLLAEKIAAQEGINVHFALTTNGSILTQQMVDFLKEYRFTVQISFEVLPDVQDAQRGMNDKVADNLVRLTENGISNYVRSTITERNVDRIAEMVEYCQTHFPKVNKLSCQQVVDPSYFTTTELVDDFFNRYFESFRRGVEQAEKTGLQLRNSSSHLINYSMRERFCYNLVCLTPYGTLTLCPDVSSPQESDYPQSVIAHIENGELVFDTPSFERLTHGSIHTIDKCNQCWAKWNCGSGCPSSRRVYSPQIFDAVCNYYRKMLSHSLMSELASKYTKATGREFYSDIAQKL